jgi:hypothetical protein
MNCRPLFSTHASPNFSIPKKLHYWLTDTMKIRYSTLNKLLERVKSCTVRVITKRKAQKRPNGSSSTQQEPTATASSNIPLEEDLPIGYVPTQAKPPALPDHYSICAGNAVGDMNQVPFVLEDGNANKYYLEMFMGVGRFHRKRDGEWNWTVDEETAEMHRQWGEIRCPGAETLLVQIQIPKSFHKSLREHPLRLEREWVAILAALVRGKIHIDIHPAVAPK